MYYAVVSPTKPDLEDIVMTVIRAVVCCLSAATCMGGTGCVSSVDAEETPPLAKTEQGLSYYNWWVRSDSGAVDTGRSTSTDFCWVTYASGTLRGANDKFSLDTSSGTWRILYSTTGQIGFGVACLAWSAVGTTTAQGGFTSFAALDRHRCGLSLCDYQGVHSHAIWPVAGGNFCYLSGLGGEFNGDGEEVSLYGIVSGSSGSYYQETRSWTSGTSQWAVCLASNHPSGGYFTANSGQDIQLESTGTSVCYLDRKSVV